MDPIKYNDPFWVQKAAEAEAKTGIPSGFLQSILLNGEKTNADRVSPAGAKTPFQVMPDTRNSLLKKYGVDAYKDAEGAAHAAALLLKESLNRNGGNIALATAEYHGGTNRKAWGPINRAYVARVVGGMSGDTGISAYTAVKGGTQPDQKQKEKELQNHQEGLATQAKELNEGIITASTLRKTGQSCIIQEGLDTIPWYDEAAIGETVVGNPHLLNKRPIWFKVLVGSSPTSYLTDKDGNQVELRLNCSLSSFDLQMKHQFSRTPTRTGMHLTLWGMTPDIIHGSGSTGAWINQYGLSNFMSTMKDKIDPISLLRIHSQWGQKQTSDEREMSQFLLEDYTQPFQVSAQDAFVEFLSLFKYNAITRFRSENYDGYFTDRDQIGDNLWSENYGTSTTVAGVRNNDVMQRGYVVLGMRKDVYLGYFKSLTFTEDTEKPYRWNFDFVFQVQGKSRSAFLVKE
jgi:hypothetical protein